jgi:hypothetical protein
MPLSSRASFLATGLVPVQKATDAYSICLTEPMDSPVQLPCEHTFCKSCITEWLNQPDRNSCAMCRKTLFSIEEEEAAANVGPDNARRQQAARALRVSGLGSIVTVGTPFPDAAPFSTVETFDISVSANRNQLLRSAARALEVVSWNTIPASNGPAHFFLNALAADLIAMGNILKHMAIQEGRPYATEGNPWGKIVAAVWTILLPKAGKDIDALTVPTMVMRSLRTQFAAQMDSPVGFFFRDQAASRDLEMLIATLVSEASQAALAQAMRRARARAHLAPPRPGTGRPARRIFPSRSSAGRSSHGNTVNREHGDGRCSVM